MYLNIFKMFLSTVQDLVGKPFLGIHKRCMDVYEHFQDDLVQARSEDGGVWDWTASCGCTSTGNNNLSLTLTFKYNVKCFDISSLHLCFWKVSVLWEFSYILKILCINQGVGPVGILIHFISFKIKVSVLWELGNAALRPTLYFLCHPAGTF